MFRLVFEISDVMLLVVIALSLLGVFSFRGTLKSIGKFFLNFPIRSDNGKSEDKPAGEQAPGVPETPEQAALRQEKQRHKAFKEQVEQYHAKLDEYGAKLKKAIANTESARLEYATKSAAAQAASEKGAQNAGELLEEAAEARDAWQRRVAIAKEYKTQYDRIAPVYQDLLEQAERGEIKVDKAELDVILTAAKRYSEGADEQSRELQGASKSPSNQQVINAALHDAKLAAGELDETVPEDRRHEYNRADRIAQAANDLDTSAPGARDASHPELDAARKVEPRVKGADGSSDKTNEK